MRQWVRLPLTIDLSRERLQVCNFVSGSLAVASGSDGIGLVEGGGSW